MLAASEEREEAGSEEYQGHHFGKILRDGFSFSGYERDHLYLNRQGESFLDISGVSGLDSDTDARAAVYADFDNDGDHDIFVTSFQRTAHQLFKNQVGQDAGFVRVELVGTASGRDAFGATVRVGAGERTLTKMKSGGAGFVSQSDPRLLFGLGAAESADWIEVEWPSGARDRFEGIPAGSSIRIVEGSGSFETVEEVRFQLPDPPSGADAFEHLLAVRARDSFPDLPLADASGKETRFVDVRKEGRCTLVNFWATYCVPCRREMPELERLGAGFREAGLDVVGISLDMGPGRGKVPQAIRQLGVTYPVYTTDETVFPSLFAGEEIFIPLTYFVDPAGKVVEVFRGWTPETQARIEALLRERVEEPSSR